MIAFECPHCTRNFQVGEQHAGQEGRCPSCQGVVRVPLPSGLRVFSDLTDSERIQLLLQVIRDTETRYREKRRQCAEWYEKAQTLQSLLIERTTSAEESAVLAARHEELQSHADRLSRELATALEALGVAKAERARVEAELAELRKVHETAMEQRADDHDRARTDLDEARRGLELAARGQEALRARVEELEAALTAADKALRDAKEAEREQDALRDRVEELETQLRQSAEAAERERGVLQARVEELETALEALDANTMDPPPAVAVDTPDEPLSARDEEEDLPVVAEVVDEPGRDAMAEVLLRFLGPGEAPGERVKGTG